MISVNDVLNSIQAFLHDRKSLDELDEVLRLYMKNPERYRRVNSKELFAGMVRVIFSYDNIKELYYLMSALYKTTMLAEAYHELIKCILEDNRLSKETKYYAYWQLSSDLFTETSLNTSDNIDLLDDLYEEIYQNYLREFTDLKKIPMTLRNRELVIVIISQVLSTNHGPTKTLLDRCYVLQKTLKKKVFIINTADVLSLNGAISWFMPGVANYYEELSNKDYLDYKDQRFSYYQCSLGMPDVGIISEIIKVITNERPWFVLSIGGGNLTSDICSKILPVLTISLSANRAQARTTFQMFTKDIDVSDLRWLSKHGMKQSQIIKGIFTYSLKEQTNKYSRSQLGIPEDKRVCLIVGWRLDEEIDDAFMDVISSLADRDISTAVVGNFKKYNSVIEEIENLKTSVIKLGLHEDVLAVYECCDIYINPKRKGGGTSAVGAMYKGLPVVTIGYGDVASAVGDYFCVEDYDEMKKRIIKLVTDENYYEVMSNKARQRAELLLDSESEFARIIHEMELRDDF